MTTPDTGPPDQPWMWVSVLAPPDVGQAVLTLLRDEFGYGDRDWCVLERRQDYSRVDYDPCPPLTAADYGYAPDWRTL